MGRTAESEGGGVLGYMGGVLGAVTDVDAGEVDDALEPRGVFGVRGSHADGSGQDSMMREDGGIVVYVEAVFAVRIEGEDAGVVGAREWFCRGRCAVAW